MPHICSKPILTFGKLIQLINEEEKMTDTFRKEYQPLNDEQKSLMNEIKTKADELLNIIDTCDLVTEVDKRCIALAKTNLEQAVMWAIKAIT